MDRAADLRRDYDRLGALLLEASPAAAAPLVRERRLIGELLEALEKPKARSRVDELAERRRSAPGSSRTSKGRRKSG